MQDIDPRLKTIANYYRFDLQADKAIEEMAELIVAIKHLKKRDGNEADHLANFVEELADVKIMVDQLVYLNDKAAPEDYSVKSEIEFKVNRTMQRIEEQKRAAEAGDYSGIAVTLTADKVAEAVTAARIARKLLLAVSDEETERTQAFDKLNSELARALNQAGIEI